MDRPDPPDPTAWGLHGALHRACPHARCAMHVHSIHATVLACLADPTLPPIDQNSAMFFDRVAVDPDYGGLALEAEAERVCSHLADPKKKVLVMASHGVMVIGELGRGRVQPALLLRARGGDLRQGALDRPAARRLPDAIAEKVAREVESYPGQSARFMAAILALLDRDGEDFRK